MKNTHLPFYGLKRTSNGSLDVLPKAFAGDILLKLLIKNLKSA